MSVTLYIKSGRDFSFEDLNESLPSCKLVSEVKGLRESKTAYGDKILRLEGKVERLVAALQKALDESGCDGDLCCHEWHEAARTAIADEVE